MRLAFGACDCARNDGRGSTVTGTAPTRRASSAAITCRSLLFAAPAGDACRAAELTGDLRNGDDPPRPGGADEDPLVRGRPGHEEPASVRRRNELPERTSAAEDGPARSEL